MKKVFKGHKVHIMYILVHYYCFIVAVVVRIIIIIVVTVIPPVCIYLLEHPDHEVYPKPNQF